MGNQCVGDGMTIWISHRGYCAEATENTVEAFDAALAHGFTHLETDLRCTRDGHIVLCHDPDLSRISGRRVAIHDLTRAELTQERLVGGESLVFFDQFIERYAHLNWILDIKPEQANQTVERLNAMSSDPAVEAFLTKQARYLFWSSTHEQRMTHRLPEATCLAREYACYRAGVAALLALPALGNIQEGQVYAVPPTLKGIPVLSERLVKHFHVRNAEVIGYLPESKQEHVLALNAGVDQILTNHAPFKAELTQPTS